LAIESAKRYPSLESDLALRGGLNLLPVLAARIPSGGGTSSAVAFSPDGCYLFTSGYDSVYDGRNFIVQGKAARL
jgi:hypothetical protein